MKYNPEKTPDPEKWRALEETQRLNVRWWTAQGSRWTCHWTKSRRYRGMWPPQPTTRITQSCEGSLIDCSPNFRSTWIPTMTRASKRGGNGVVASATTVTEAGVVQSQAKTPALPLTKSLPANRSSRRNLPQAAFRMALRSDAGIVMGRKKFLG